MSYDVPTTDGPRGPIFLAALRGAISRPPLWLACWLVTALLAAAAAAPWVDWFADATANRYAPHGFETKTSEEGDPIALSGETLAGLRETFRFDHDEELSDLRGRTAGTTTLLGLIAMLFGAFTAGGWLQVCLERTSGHSVRRFLWGASRYFWRFVRVWVLTLAALAFVSWFCLGWPWNTFVAGFLFGATGGETEVLVSEWSSVWLGWLQAGAYALAFALVLAWGDYTRTRMALLDTRSAFLAGLGSLALLLRHPVQALRPIALLFFVEVFALWLCGAFSSSISGNLSEAGSWHDVALMFVVGQLALMWRTITRGARYYAAASVSRRLVPPLSQPDRWADRVGGPGGPQYPIDPTDEYGVSL